jgi:hypothetical protein
MVDLLTSLTITVAFTFMEMLLRLVTLDEDAQIISTQIIKLINQRIYFTRITFYTHT